MTASTSEEERGAKLMPAGQPTNAENFVNAISCTLAAANRYLTALLQEAGLENVVPSHGEILMRLFAEEPIAMQDLAHAIHRDPSTVTVLVRKLIDGGYVSTSKSAADKRVTEVSLTEKGRSMRASFEEISKQLRSAQMEGIDSDAFRITCATLDAVRDNFIKHLEEDCDIKGDTL